MAQNGGPVQHSRSRSGLLVAKEVLDDKLSDCGKVFTRPGMVRMQSCAWCKPPQLGLWLATADQVAVSCGGIRRLALHSARAPSMWRKTGVRG